MCLNVNSVSQGKYFMTKHFTGSVLYEYEDTPPQSALANNATAQYNIKDLFYGTGGVVYRGAFYYHRLVYFLSPTPSLSFLLLLLFSSATPPLLLSLSLSSSLSSDLPLSPHLPLSLLLLLPLLCNGL